MEAKNFRIGNWVKVKSSPKGEYTTIQPSSFECITEYVPIKLTIEWLTRLGFTLDKYGYYVNGAFHCFIGDTDLTKGKIIFATNFDRTVIIKYVHQLQNLFFALTDTELNIKHKVSACR